VIQLKRTEELFSLIEAFVPSLKNKVAKVNKANISKFIKCVEHYFIIEQFNLSSTESLESDINRLGIEIVKKLRTNPNSRVGF
jgi:hypothetical protein